MTHVVMAEVDITGSFDPDLSTTTAGSPLSVEGETVRFNPDLMERNRMYGFGFLGHRWYAFKDHDDSVNFFYVPQD